MSSQYIKDDIVAGFVGYGCWIWRGLLDKVLSQLLLVIYTCLGDFESVIAERTLVVIDIVYLRARHIEQCLF